jgi:glycosyltransferase involved in cell wall biosynthesis
MNSKKVILCLLSEYLPGFKSGGPIKTISNLVNQLGDEFEFRIICRDRDLGDSFSYSGVIMDNWNKVGKAKVFYASSKTISFFGIIKILRKTKYDILYLNSFFNFYFTILPLFLRYFFVVTKKPCAIAPRGELAKNAIELKKKKKFLFLWLVKVFGLYNNLYWQASSQFELNDIRRELGLIAKKIKIAPDLISIPNLVINKNFKRKPGLFRIIFLSRISPIKNLDYLIKVFAKVKTPFEFSIFGPKLDFDYWVQCKKLIDKLPSHIKVNIGEQIFPSKVKEVFSQYDLFAFPTKGENFGHVILESLSAGTPVLLSDQTFWQTDKLLGLQTLSLNKKIWVNAVDKWANLSKEKLLVRRRAALAYANKINIKNKKALIMNKYFFFGMVKSI